MNATAALIADLPLKEMEASLLRTALVEGATAAGLDTDKLNTAIDIAAYAHRDQLRANRGLMPRVHYIEHPLRVAARLLRYGCTDLSVLTAAVLHDTVEDSARRIAIDFLHANVDEPRARDMVLGYYAGLFGGAVAHIVGSVSNPLPDSASVGREASNARYVTHVLSVIGDPNVFLVKFSDFVDNALSLHHTFADEANHGMVKRLAQKYLPLERPFADRLEHLDVKALVGSSGLRQMRVHLSHSRLTEYAAELNVAA